MYRYGTSVGTEAIPFFAISSIARSLRGRWMLDTIDAGLNGPVDVLSLRIHGHRKAERVSFLDRGIDFRLRVVTRELDDVRALLELHAHGVAPLIRPRCLCEPAACAYSGAVLSPNPSVP